MANEKGVDKRLVELLLLGKGGRQRFVQDSPILPDVWKLFGEAPTKRHDLLISPLESHSAMAVMRATRDELKKPLGEDPEKGLVREALEPAKLAPLQSYVAACLTFDELVYIVLPLTKWVDDARIAMGERRKAKRWDTAAAFRQVCAAAEGILPTSATFLRGHLFEVARVLTLIAAIEVGKSSELAPIEDVPTLRENGDVVIEHMDKLIERLAQREISEPLIARITGNRGVAQTSLKSRETVKADAAFRLFNVDCQDVTWAVIDSGIDQKHPAFQRRVVKPGQSASRVIRSYELGFLRELLNVAYEDRPEDNPVLARCIESAQLEPATAKQHLERAYQSFATDILDWSSIEPLIRLADAPTPTDGHGTHVAGIIGADWRGDKDKVILEGLCPDIQLMDFRIIGNDLDETEYAVLGALQLVRYLNSHNQHIMVHGVNISLSIPHQVGSFGCGRTPVCMECERLIGAGTTVVAAAGNAGYQAFEVGTGRFNGYTPISITDPGNAESVITVGATHKREPHAYGVSYFSSRGPTADGRHKPDLLAPGERIESTLPDNDKGFLDGTSQAAPHVSAAAAMLMARYPELNREPKRIKQILCESATDLGREKFFQGHGLLDILRALQSF